MEATGVCPTQSHQAKCYPTGHNLTYVQCGIPHIKPANTIYENIHVPPESWYLRRPPSVFIPAAWHGLVFSRSAEEEAVASWHWLSQLSQPSAFTLSSAAQELQGPAAILELTLNGETHRTGKPTIALTPLTYIIPVISEHHGDCLMF